MIRVKESKKQGTKRISKAQGSRVCAQSQKPQPPQVKVTVGVKCTGFKNIILGDYVTVLAYCIWVDFFAASSGVMETESTAILCAKPPHSGYKQLTRMPTPRGYHPPPPLPQEMTHFFPAIFTFPHKTLSLFPTPLSFPPSQ